jgi:hypothetical protein
MRLSPVEKSWPYRSPRVCAPVSKSCRARWIEAICALNAESRQFRGALGAGEAAGASCAGTFLEPLVVGGLDGAGAGFWYVKVLGKNPPLVAILGVGRAAAAEAPYAEPAGIELIRLVLLNLTDSSLAINNS